MNRIPMSRAFLTLLLLASTLLGGVIKPDAAKDARDILIVSGNRSSYYALHKEALVYKVRGPQRIKIYSRGVLNRRVSGSQDYGFEIQLNGDAPLQVHHKQRRSKGVKSPQHPNHYFTRSAIDYIVIPDGVNELILRPNKGGKPVVVRVLEDDERIQGKKQRVSPLSQDAPVTLLSKGKRLTYYRLSHEHTLHVNLDGPTNLEIMSRLGFDPRMGRQEDYRIQVTDAGKLLGTYYFTTERSEVTTVEGQDEVVAGKWRTCQVSLGKGTHELKLRLLDKDRTVFVKLNEVDDP